MAVGLGVLRLPAAQFWAMTPRELASAVRGLSGIRPSAPPIDRRRLLNLMSRYPDAIGAG